MFRETWKSIDKRGIAMTVCGDGDTVENSAWKKASWPMKAIWLIFPWSIFGPVGCVWNAIFYIGFTYFVVN